MDQCFSWQFNFSFNESTRPVLAGILVREAFSDGCVPVWSQVCSGAGSLQEMLKAAGLPCPTGPLLLPKACIFRLLFLFLGAFQES